ncbi:MAG: 50S ribosomal protein L33 [Bacilli bacterium]|nr:50S ribosomal protein L33 [Bacilli bacterium]
MAKKGENRALVSLKCTECNEINYRVEKNKVNDPERMELSKYCNRCKKHTKHKESKSA